MLLSVVIFIGVFLFVYGAVFWSDEAMNIGVCILFFPLLYMVIGSIASTTEDVIARHTIAAIGYNVKSVNVFLNGVDMSPQQFINSRGLRLQYSRFEAGKEDLDTTAKQIAEKGAPIL